MTLDARARNVLPVFTFALIGACSSAQPSGDGSGGSGSSASGGSNAGGMPVSSGGALAAGGAITSASGGVAAGGKLGTGGAAGTSASLGGSSGSSSGGPNALGGAQSGGGTNTGGSGSGGSGSGGSGSGGVAGSGGKNSGGSSALAFDYFIGADVTDQEVAPAATRATLLTTLKAHGFNFIRLRTFVDPKASDGYDRTNGYDDIAHTIDFGKQIKAAGMGLFIDFHYSDNWADPGKQCVPVAWQKYSTIAELAAALHDYTKDSINQLIAGGARPDLVQVGNETTPGMLLHRCDSDGQPTGSNPITGSISNWANLGALLKAGVQGVKEVDPAIVVSLHIDRGGDKASDTPGAALQFSTDWITNALKYTSFDAFGESCYQRYQGDPNSTSATKTSWTNTFGGLASKFPNLKFFAAEYGPMQREVNDVVFNMPNKQGIGTFNWEPTTQGDWNSGHDLLRLSGSSYTAQPDLALYDQMKTDYAARL